MAFFPKRMASLGASPATSRIQLVTRDSVMVMDVAKLQLTQL